MKIKNISFELIFFNFIVIMSMLSGYIGGERVWKLLLLAGMFYLLANRSRNRKCFIKYLENNYYIIPTVLLGVLSAFLGKSREYLLINIRGLLWVLLVLISLYLIKSSNKIDFHILFSRFFVFINVLWLLNLIIVSIQVQGNSFMIKQQWLQLNPYYKDHCSGLFGYNGTHGLTVFSIFVMYFNLRVAENKELKNNKRGLLYGFIILTEIWMLYVSRLNDNMAYFMILPLFVLLYFYFRIRRESKNIRTRISKIIKNSILIVLIVIIALIIPAIREFVFVKVYERINMFLFTDIYEVRGSNERLAIVIQSLQNGKGFFWGEGLGVMRFASEGYGGFIHFGLSDIGPFILLGGIWFYILYSLMYCRFVEQIAVSKRIRISDRIIVLSVIMILSVYTGIFTNFRLQLWFALIIWYMIGRYE